MELAPYIKARKAMIEGVRAQMLGPGSEGGGNPEHERLHEAPTNRYACGILYPEKRAVDESRDISATEIFGDIAELENGHHGKQEAQDGGRPSQEEADGLSEDISRSGQMRPSSFGLTFFVRGEVSKVAAEVAFGTYRGEKETAADGEKEQTVYVRTPHHVRIQAIFQTEDYTEVAQNIDGTRLSCRAMRRRMPGGITSVTFMAVNGEQMQGNLPEVQECIFQPCITVGTATNGFSFVSQEAAEAAIRAQRRKNRQEVRMDEGGQEELRLAMLYRKKHRYASGFGTSVGWKVNAAGQGSVWNEFLPEIELPAMDYDLREDVDVKDRERALSMKYYSDLDPAPWEEKLSCLRAIVASYRRWILKQEQEAGTLSEEFRVIGRKNLAACTESADRMEDGIRLIEDDEDVRKAFALANRAMFMQRVQAALQGKWHKEAGRPYYGKESFVKKALSSIDYRAISDDDAHWRPFQLAFLVMSLCGIVEAGTGKTDDRMLVDLIWFPTGGGKTEAYLGLSAFTIFYRRFAHPEDYGGTNILMRYTLRMLTAQQFTRAATLICACELIRRQCSAPAAVGRGRRRQVESPYPRYDGLGTEPVSIGLWIGSAHSPNKYGDAVAAAKKDFNKENMFQVLRCPWCGTEMVPASGRGNTAGCGYLAEKDSFRFVCPQDGCEFSQKNGGLPLQVVDEGLYEAPPTLLIGTIDKFAQMAWRGDVQNFFSKDAEGGKGRGPELIIQDELHLISGPLGSIAGLYEMGIDEVCRRNGNPPKIIASTATIRRADAQCRALYDREMRQFPAPALDADDSYFSRTDDSRPGRAYLGVMASGRRKATMEVRLISALASLPLAIDMPLDVRDAYWTLTCYFNAIRELGQCQTLIADDVAGELRSFRYRMGCARQRYLDEPVELTSRMTSGKLNRALGRLESVRYHESVQPDGTCKQDSWPVPLLLASNMLSVGIDIARLNVMLMVGQPKLTSEYIQASSRIGRSVPGLVCVLYDALRSRDRSYYEQFRSFHETFYRYVEPTGATPFSLPAMERALHAAALCVLRGDPVLRKTHSAFHSKEQETAVQELIHAFLERCRDVQSALHMDPAVSEQYIRQHLESFFATWDALADRYGDSLVYRHPMNGGWRTSGTEKHGLLRNYGEREMNDEDQSYETLTSMRSVDKAIRGNLHVWGEGI